MTDIELVEKIKNGDERAYRFIYKHKSLIIKMVYNKGGSHEDGEDVFQNMMLILIRKMRNPNFVLTSKLSTYIFTISHYCWLKVYDKKKRFSAKDVPDIYADFEMSFKDENTINLNSLLLSLPKQQRSVILDYYYADKSMNEIAEHMGHLSSDTTKTMKLKAMRNLQKNIVNKFSYDDFFYN